MAVKDANGNVLIIIPSENATHLVDESLLVPEYQSYLNGTIFDEVYHARTGYEFIHHLTTYEWTHPPLGKIFIALGIKIFGMNPFGWRIPGTLFGIMMLPLFYVFSKRIFKKTWVATATTILFASDFMHFTQTRIATIDVFVVLFIIGMYYFMYCYYDEPHTDNSLKDNWKLLALSGLFMGLAISCKWTGVYGAFGLAVIFFISLFKKDWNSKRFMKTIVVCCLFFIIIPFIIYTLCYIPVVRNEGVGLLGRMWKDQAAMLTYHKEANSEHPYSSMFYQWPIIYRPILYYARTIEENLSETISSFGNPLIWWSGILAFFILLYDSIIKKNKNALFIIIGYLAQYLPWIFVGRTLFIYHYFPSVPFVILMIGYVMNDLVKNNKRDKKWCYIYVAVSVLLFILFYPVLSGYPVNKEYVSIGLCWHDSWVF
jgi:dolichyl-phosphate-mannose--protein O-mannosyl transferase